jgi:hypothetical protein
MNLVTNLCSTRPLARPYASLRVRDRVDPPTPGPPPIPRTRSRASGLPSQCSTDMSCRLRPRPCATGPAPASAAAPGFVRWPVHGVPRAPQRVPVSRPRRRGSWSGITLRLLDGARDPPIFLDDAIARRASADRLRDVVLRQVAVVPGYHVCVAVAEIPGHDHQRHAAHNGV